MISEHRTFYTSLPAAACALRLQRLAAESVFVVARPRDVIEIAVSQPELEFLGQQTYVFRLRARCHDRGYRRTYGATVFLSVAGRIVPEGEATQVTLAYRSGRPSSARWWILQIAWYVVFAAILVALILGALTTGDARLWELSGGTLLLIAFLYGCIVMAYGGAVRAITALLERALAALQESEPASRIALKRQ